MISASTIAEVRAVSQGLERERIMRNFPEEFSGVFPSSAFPDDNWELQQFVEKFNRALGRYKDRMQLSALRQFGVLNRDCGIEPR